MSLIGTCLNAGRRMAARLGQVLQRGGAAGHPGAHPRIDRREMVNALKPLLVDHVTCSDRRGGVTIALVDRHYLVLDPMDQSRRDADGYQLVRGRNRVSLWDLRRRAAQEPDDGAASQTCGRALHEVKDARLGYDTPDADHWLPTRRVRRELVSASQPHRELPAGRMSDGDDAVEVEPAIRSRISDVGERVGGSRDVEQ